VVESRLWIGMGVPTIDPQLMDVKGMGIDDGLELGIQ
jgi:hypothetical protein